MTQSPDIKIIDAAKELAEERVKIGKIACDFAGTKKFDALRHGRQIQEALSILGAFEP